MLCGFGEHFQARGHSFSLYGPTLSRQITYLFFPADKEKCVKGFISSYFMIVASSSPVKFSKIGTKIVFPQ